MKNIILALLILFSLGGFAQINSTGAVINGSFENGVDKKPDARSQVSGYVYNWSQSGNPDWYTVRQYGPKIPDDAGIWGYWNEQRGYWNDYPNSGTGAGVVTNYNNQTLMSPYRGDFFVGLGACEKIITKLNEIDIEDGCEVIITFKWALRDYHHVFYPNTYFSHDILVGLSNSQQANSGETCEELCGLNYDYNWEDKYTYEVGLKNGNPISFPKPGIWNTYKSQPIAWNSSQYVWLSIGVMSESTGVCGLGHSDYLFIDEVDIEYMDANLGSTTAKDITISGETISTLRNESVCKTITVTPKQQMVSATSFVYTPTVITAESHFEAGDFILFKPDAQYAPPYSSGNNYIEIKPEERRFLAEIGSCLSCIEVPSGPDIDICYKKGKEPGTVNIPIFNLKDIAPVPETPGRNYNWTCVNEPLMNASIVNSNLYGATVQVAGDWPTNGNGNGSDCLDFIYKLKETDGNGNVTGEWLVQIMICECEDYNPEGERIILTDETKYVLYDKNLSPNMDSENTNSLENKIDKLPFGVNTGGNLNTDNIYIYPNPAQDYVKVAFAEDGNYNIILYDISGKKVYSNSIINKRVANLNLSSFESGVYTLRIIDETGSVVSNKLIIQ